MPLLETKGAASAQGFGLTLGSTPAYIENLFSTHIYTGTGVAQTITNGLDLAGGGGLVWIKSRSGAYSNQLVDTVRGGSSSLSSNSINTAATGTYLTFNSSGFVVENVFANWNESATTYASWAFRRAAKFFDVVTYTGTGANRTVAHALGVVPGCIMVKSVNTTAVDWAVYHRSLANTEYLILNGTNAGQTGATWWNSTTPTSTAFSVGTSSATNELGVTYVAYLFAHDAGGFGWTGGDDVVSCGSYTGNGSATGPVVTLGYEPQWLLVKNTTGASDWNIIDNIRGFVVGGTDSELNPNLADVESTGTFVTPTATGFQVNTTDSGYNTNSSNYVYIAIRRGPMKTPTDPAKVFAVSTFSTTTSSQTISANAPTDMALLISNPVNQYHYFATRLIGPTATLRSTSTNAQSTTLTDVPTPTGQVAFNYLQNSFRIEGSNQTNWNADGSGTNSVGLFTRAPGFFDVVCYTGAGVSAAYDHNLGVAPELIIIKRRTGAATNWVVGQKDVNNGVEPFAGRILYLNSDVAEQSLGRFYAVPTATQVFLTNQSDVGSSAVPYVMYLFATVAGVSKVGTYTGTATTQQINCGFTSGARFVMIKRVDSVAGWFVWDSARGIVAGDDPYVLLNSTAAEVTNTDYVDTYSAGFEISNNAVAEINASGGKFIFLAIA